MIHIRNKILPFNAVLIVIELILDQSANNPTSRVIFYNLQILNMDPQPAGQNQMVLIRHILQLENEWDSDDLANLCISNQKDTNAKNNFRKFLSVFCVGSRLLPPMGCRKNYSERSEIV